MELLTEPALQVPLPRPLSDPLRFHWWLLLFIVPLTWVSLVLNSILPDVGKVREAAACIKCSNNLKQLGLAVANYTSTYDSKLPGIEWRYQPSPGVGADGGGSGQTILCTLLPYVEQDALYKTGMTGQPFFNVNTAAGTAVRAVPIKPYQCPSDPSLVNGYATSQVGSWGGSSYAGNFQLFGESNQASLGQSSIAQYQIGNISDGTSNTVGFAERDSAWGSVDSGQNNGPTRMALT